MALDLRRRLAPTEENPLRARYIPAWETPIGLRKDEWIVACADEGDAGDATRFRVVVDAGSNAIRSVSWVNPRPRRTGAAVSSEGGAGREDVLSPDRATAAARRCVRLLGLPNASGPWRASEARRTFADPPSRDRVWCVHLSSPDWTAWVVLDAATAELSQLLLMPARRPA